MKSISNSNPTRHGGTSGNGNGNGNGNEDRGGGPHPPHPNSPLVGRGVAGGSTRLASQPPQVTPAPSSPVTPARNELELELEERSYPSVTRSLPHAALYQPPTSRRANRADQLPRVEPPEEPYPSPEEPYPSPEEPQDLPEEPSDPPEATRKRNEPSRDLPDEGEASPVGRGSRPVASGNPPHQPSRGTSGGSKTLPVRGNGNGRGNSSGSNSNGSNVTRDGAGSAGGRTPQHPTLAQPYADHLPSLEHLIAQGKSGGGGGDGKGGGGLDLEGLLRAQGSVAPKRSLLDRAQGFVSGVSGWLDLGGRVIGGPVSFLFDHNGGDGEGSHPFQNPQETVYMSRLKKQLYNLGAALIWLFSAFITQGVCSHIFPFLDTAFAATKDGFFKDGVTLSVKAILASLVFTFMLSIIETMLYDPHKSRAKKLLIGAAFLVDIAINTIGWSDLFGHSSRFEWLPFAPLLRGQEFEWGSFICEFTAILNAAMPEMMWHKARHARTGTGRKALSGVGDAGLMTSAPTPVGTSQGQGQGQGQSQRGLWVRNAQGQAQWLSETQLKQLQDPQKRAGGSGGSNGSRNKK